MGKAYPTKLIEYAVKIDQNLALCNFGNIVHGFTCIVSHAGILISEAGKHRWNNFCKIAWEILTLVSQLLHGVTASTTRSRHKAVERA